MKSPNYTWILKLLILLMILSEALYANHHGAESENLTETTINSEILTENDPYETHFFRVRGIPNINVNTINGNIDLISDPALNGVKVELFVERSFTLWSGPRSLDDFRIIIRQQGDRIIASVEERRTVSSRRRGDVQFHFIVYTPYEVNSDLRTLNGDIFIENVKGDHFTQNQTGNISVFNSTGRTQVSSTMGDIVMDGLSGVTFAKSVNGNIDLSNSSGEMRLRTVTGNIGAYSASGTLVAATTSGSIKSNFRQVSIGVYLETVSGNIDLAIPIETSYRIDGEAMRFDFTGMNQDSVTNLSRRNRTAALITGAGEIPVQLSTIAGQIKVSHTSDDF